MTPTIEQEAIINAALTTEDNLLISALAGAAKTSTLELICKALPVQPILSLAFNKKIAEEMTRRLPGHVACRTLNSIGHRVWSQACSKKVTLNVKKSYEILSAKVGSLRKADKEEAFEYFSEILRGITVAKLKGYIPDGKYTHATRLCKTDYFYNAPFWEEDPSDIQRTLIDEVLTDSIKLAYDGVIDFDDQIYMPTLFGGTFPKFPLVLVDEAQDLSAINHAMLEKLVTARLIAVGDPWQSIYGFRGAVAGGMSSLKNTFNMRELGLSISFRCPREVVRNAQRIRVPHMQWPEWAEEGKVNALDQWSAESIPDGAAIICRNNAPLFSCALRLLRAGRGVQLIGSDLGPGLIKVLKKLGPESLTKDEVHVAINSWEAERLSKSKAKAATKDRAECLRVFADFGDTLASAIAYAEHLFAAKGPVQLLSGHKAKGLEFDTVFILDAWRIPSPYAETFEELEQEKNIAYVMATRAKQNLFYVDLETFDAA